MTEFRQSQTIFLRFIVTLFHSNFIFGRKNNEQRAKSNEQRAKGSEKLAKSNE